jgi:HTH-type transcriptional regulator/antitoxin HigA
MAEGELRPARPVAPGRILRRELDERGWTQQDLARIVDRPPQVINQIVQGKKQITPDTAIEFAQAFGTSAEFWTNLEAAYRLQLAAQQDPGDAIGRRSKLYAVAPVRELTKRGWVEDAADEDVLERNVLEFLDLRSFDEPLPQAASFRCSPARTPDQRGLYAWTRRVEILASQQTTGAYDRTKLEAGIPGILELARTPEQVVRVPAALLALGVRCVIVPRLERTYADGAALHANEQPVVALTLRLDRIDNFWFTLMHELAHLVLGHEGSFIDETGETDCVLNSCEKRADRLASDWLAPPRAYRAFLAERRSRFPLDAVTAFAASIDRHPGIVVGRLHYDGKLNFKYLRKALVKVSPYLEGWVDRPAPLGAFID